MITESELAQLRTNVEAGVKWLKIHQPKKFAKIDWVELDMCKNCIIHQQFLTRKFYSYPDAIKSLGLTIEQARSLGFDIDADMWNSHNRQEYFDALTALWQELGPC